MDIQFKNLTYRNYLRFFRAYGDYLDIVFYNTVISIYLDGPCECPIKLIGFDKLNKCVLEPIRSTSYGTLISVFDPDTGFSGEIEIPNKSFDVTITQIQYNDCEDREFRYVNGIQTVTFEEFRSNVAWVVSESSPRNV